MQIDLLDIVAQAWQDYDSTRAVHSVDDISVLVSTNHVFRVRLQNGDLVVAKLSYFGRYEHFVEDHSLLKKNQLYTYRHQTELVDVWVVFYNPIGVD